MNRGGLWRQAVLTVLLALAGAPARADNIRGLVAAEIRVQVAPEFEQTVELRSQQFAVVFLPADTTFLDGVQFELTLSAGARDAYDSYGFVVYDRLEMRPGPGVVATAGRRAFLHGLLAMNRLFYVAQVSGSAAGRNDPSQGLFRLPHPDGATDYPILVGIVPIMKGVPDTLQSLAYYLRCRPIVRNAGMVTIRLLPARLPDALDIAVSVDGAPLEISAGTPSAEALWEATIELPAGIHTLRVSSPRLQKEETTFSVDAGGRSVVATRLRELAPSVAIDAPREALVYIDGEKMDFPRETRAALAVGEHTIRLKLGEYSATRTFTAAEGKSYTISMEVGVTVKED